MSVIHWLAQRTRATPDRPALEYDGQVRTWKELTDAVLRRVASLQEAGVRAGDRVALLLPSGTRFVELVHAVTWCGAAVLPLNTRLTTSEIEFQLEDARPSLVIHDSKPPLADVAREAAQGAGLESVVSILELEEIGRSLNAPGDLPSVDPRAAAAVVYTSGTTGHPKGACLTFRNLNWSAMASVTRLQTRADDRWLACMPLFHVGGLSILIRAAVSGSTVVLHDRFDETALDHALEKRGITGVSLVPAMLDRWLAHRRGRHTPRSLRVALVGGGPLSGSLHRKGIASGCPVVPTYGLTEAASQVATLSPAEIGHHPSTVGRALPGTRLRIAAEDGRPLPPDREGEIQVAAPTVMTGYLNRPEETERVLADGWLRTGDVGLLTEEGYLRVLDRRTDLIVSGGENVYPREVEEALAAHPAVLDVAVVGVDDRRFGKRPAAWVSLRPGHRAETAELIAFCRERIAGYKVPSEVRFVDAIPRNSTGKLQRERLRGPSTHSRPARAGERRQFDA